MKTKLNLFLPILVSGSVLFVVSHASAAAAPKKEKSSAIATDTANCKIIYDNSKAERSLMRKCQNSKAETKYFALDDTSAPLLQNETYKIENRSYLATRWATGHGEEVVIFDLSKDNGEPAYRVVSDGPSTVSFDTKAKRVKIIALTAAAPESTAQPVSKTILWPVSPQ